MKVEDFIKQNTISERKALLDALCMPLGIPDSFGIKPLEPVGVGRFAGDKMPSGWSCNDQLELGGVYPIYSREGRFVVGKNGKGLKFNPQNWRNITWF